MLDIHAAFDKHANIALQFSGGKDSLACLYLLEDHWDRLTVVWLNTGSSYPETINQMEQIKNIVPHFQEIKTEQKSWVDTYGFPVDILPVDYSPIGSQVRKMEGPLLQPWSGCCMRNIWEPLRNKMREMGVTLIIRGQKNSDYRTAPIQSGYTEDGFEYWFPLETWTTDDVYDFLNKNGVPIPSYYSWSDTSLDCWNCTAFLVERKKEISSMKQIHPEKWEIVGNRLKDIYRVTKNEIDLIGNIINA